MGTFVTSRNGFLIMEMAVALVVLCLIATGCISTFYLYTKWARACLTDEAVSLLTQSRLSAIARFQDHTIKITPTRLEAGFPSSTVFLEAPGPLSFTSSVQSLGFKASGRARQSGTLWVGSSEKFQKISLAVNTGKLSWEP